MGRKKKNPNVQRYIGKKHTPTYACWSSIKSCCLNPSHPQFKNYGGRGVRICDRWLDFDNFYEDMGLKPDGLILERIDSDGDYEPCNCRWVTPKGQIPNQHLGVEDWIFVAVHKDGTVVASNHRGKFAKKYELDAVEVGCCLDGELEECDGWRFKKLINGSDIKLIKDAKLLF